MAPRKSKPSAAHGFGRGRALFLAISPLGVAVLSTPSDACMPTQD